MAPAASGAVFNLCSGRARRVSELIAAIQSALGTAQGVSFADQGEDVLLGSPERLMRATGWSPRHDLADTARTIADEER